MIRKVKFNKELKILIYILNSLIIKITFHRDDINGNTRLY